MINFIAWDLSSAGRASALQAEGHRFEPYRSHFADVAQLAEQLICNQQVIGSSPIIGLDINAGWSSLEARRAHNPKVVGSNPTPATHAQIAQLVEQRTENPRVAGSIPALGIFYGALAQSVEHLTFNQVVRGSNPRCFI